MLRHTITRWGTGEERLKNHRLENEKRWLEQRGGEQRLVLIRDHDGSSILRTMLCVNRTR